MRVRWIVATVGAGPGSLDARQLGLWFEGSALAPGGCPANAKPANLNFTLRTCRARTSGCRTTRARSSCSISAATWCGPCKIEIPWFIEFQKTYGPQGLQVIGVSVDDTVEKLRPYVKEYKMNYPVLQGLHHDDIQDAYGPLWGIPVTTIISRDGKICAKHAGISSKENFEKEIKSLL